MNTPQLLRPFDPASLLTQQRRGRDLASLGHGVDVLVIGGGITGVGVALDAATRGLSVALIERDDLAFGTSRWSSKLVHGGLRYLAKGDIGVAWESAVERGIIAGIVAPHLIRPMPQVVPSYDHDRTPARLALAGFRAGDALRIAARTPRGLLPRARHIGREETLHYVPGLKREGLRGAALGWDCQLEDDARLVVAVARTAAAYGAKIITQAEATGVDHATGVTTVCDRTTGMRSTVSAKWVVNATGVWAGELDPMITLRPSLGSHAIVWTALLGDGQGSLTVPVPGHVGRFVFTMPKGDGLSYIGITDNPLAGPIPDHPTAPAADIDWILATVSTVLARPLTRADVVGTYAGVRPLVESLGSESADISRRHLVRESGALITVTGGKLTTYRRMAQDVVDLTTERPCQTQSICLVGAGPQPTRLDVPARLWRRYGNEAPDVWDLGRDDVSLRDPVPQGYGVLGVEVAFAMLAELAVTTSDVVDRRTRVGLLNDDTAFRAEVTHRLRARQPVA